MTTVEAINVLLQGVEAGRKHAIYTFQDAALIYEAINVLTGNNQNGQQKQEDKTGDFAFDEKKDEQKKKK